MSRDSHTIERLAPAGSHGCLHLSSNASSRRYGSPLRPAFFSEIFNN